jgi:hypothetical protein
MARVGPCHPALRRRSNATRSPIEARTTASWFRMLKLKVQHSMARSARHRRCCNHVLVAGVSVQVERLPHLCGGAATRPRPQSRPRQKQQGLNSSNSKCSNVWPDPPNTDAAAITYNLGVYPYKSVPPPFAFKAVQAPPSFKSTNHPPTATQYVHHKDWEPGDGSGDGTGRRVKCRHDARHPTPNPGHVQVEYFVLATVLATQALVLFSSERQHVRKGLAKSSAGGRRARGGEAGRFSWVPW